MGEGNGKRRVAIACQGGGSHAAFTAGALKRILEKHEYDVVALSGTSGGAVCAFLAWYALLNGERGKAVELLESFWVRDNAAYLKAGSPSSVNDVLTNDLLIGMNRFLEATVGVPTINPYDFPYSIGAIYTQDKLGEMIREKLEGSIQERVDSARSDVRLFIGAINAVTGGFRVFKGHKEKEDGTLGFNDSEEDGLSIEAILASAAVPTIFQAVRTGKEVYRDAPLSRTSYIDEGVYWDGLYSQNPPIRDLTEAKPDEIWVVQINPEEIEKEPTTTAKISDRRNELAGNISLNQELYFIRKINELVRRMDRENGTLPALEGYKIIKVRRIELTLPLPTSSKMDRSLAFVERLMDHGEERADHFLRIIPFQLRLEAAWEKAVKTKDEQAVMNLFAEDAIIRLVPPATPASDALTYTGEGLRKAVKQCLEQNFNLEQSRDYRTDTDTMACWVLATSDRFQKPVKGWVEAAVRNDKIESLDFYPLTLEVAEELRKTVPESRES